MYAPPDTTNALFTLVEVDSSKLLTTTCPPNCAVLPTPKPPATVNAPVCVFVESVVFCKCTSYWLPAVTIGLPLTHASVPLTFRLATQAPPNAVNALYVFVIVLALVVAR